MSSFLERYERGEHEQVWDDLLALGTAVREEPLYADALAVARETMRRARYNVEALVAQLAAMGFRFGYDSWVSRSEAPKDWRLVEGLAPPPPFVPPAADVAAQLAAFETRIGTLPLALHAWFEQVGAVNLVGMFPLDDPRDREGFIPTRQWALLQRQRSSAFPPVSVKVSGCRHDLDPLWVDPLDKVVQSAFRPRGTAAGYEVDLAPDEFFKYLYAGGGSYTLTLPNVAADAPLEGEWHDTTFVNYLRICFRWGGFPGLECQSRRPATDLALLTKGLLPM